MHAEGLVSDDVVHHLGLEPGDVRYVRKDGLTSLFGVGETGFVIHCEPALDGGDRAYHLLAVNLVGATDAPDAAALVAHEGLVAQLAYEVLCAERESRLTAGAPMYLAAMHWKSAPMRTYLPKFSSGYIWPAASTVTATPRSRAISMQSSSGRILVSGSCSTA